MNDDEYVQFVKSFTSSSILDNNKQNLSSRVFDPSESVNFEFNNITINSRTFKGARFNAISKNRVSLKNIKTPYMLCINFICRNLPEKACSPLPSNNSASTCYPRLTWKSF